MARASALLDGVTAPIDSGFSIQERMKRTSSLSGMRFFCSKRRKCVSIFFSIAPRFSSKSRICFSNFFSRS